MPKITLVLLLIFTLLSCKSKTNQAHPVKNISRDLQTILDNANVRGSIIISDKNQKTYYTNSIQEAAQSSIPASTFKIPNSIIGLETGVINKETIFKWDGEERAYSTWEKDLTLKDAFQKSCVPCYQELARKIGVNRMNTYLSKLEFGQMDVNESNIDNFWLIGESNINPFQQIHFLRKFYKNELDISESTSKTMKNILIIDEQPSYTLSGKTGLGIHDGGNTGWFVGYVEKEEKVYYFATKIHQKDQNMSRAKFSPLRKDLTMNALRYLKIIP